MTELIQIVRNAGPYLAIEMLLPGGSVIALLLWLFRHRSTVKLTLTRWARRRAKACADSGIAASPIELKQA
jgi:hypothetical protein